MVQKEAVFTDKAPAPLPFFSQAIKCQGMVYCSGSIGTDPKTGKMVEGGIADRTVSTQLSPCFQLPSSNFYAIANHTIDLAANNKQRNNA